MWILSCVQLTNTCSKLKNSFLVTLVALSTAKTTSSEKTIYFLTLLSRSINKVLMLFTCKNFIFSEFAWKNIFCYTKWWGRRGRGRANASCPLLSLSHCVRNILWTYVSALNVLRIPSVLSAFLHTIWSPLSSLFPKLSFLL